jgi:hypothetical protein
MSKWTITKVAPATIKNKDSIGMIDTIILGIMPIKAQINHNFTKNRIAANLMFRGEF